MRLNGMNHGFVFTEPLGVFHTKLHMRAVELMVKRLADIVQKACPAGDLDIRADFGSHEPRNIGNLQGVVEHILAVACTVLELAEELHELRMHAVDARVYYGALACLLDGSLYLTACFVNGFLDPGRMDAPVRNQLFEGHAGNFTAHRVKAGKCDGFGRVVNDEIDARDRFKRTDCLLYTSPSPRD